MTIRVIVPRVVDEANLNSQNLNARSLLARFGREECEWLCTCYGKPDPVVSANPSVKITRLAPWRFWPWHTALFYQNSADAIFYPGVQWFDWLALQLRDRMRRSIPVVATFEGLVGDVAREQQISQIVGHPVYCQRVSTEVLHRVDCTLKRADHIFAISPFLGALARKLYGDKCSVLPLGIDLDKFAPSDRPNLDRRKKVISVGNVQDHKRPETFIGLAERFRDAEFSWIGEGDRRSSLVAAAARRGIKNLSFPGAFTRTQVADELRTADVFVMPSRAEGVPKATQEAVASGLPCVVFGYYEAPSVINGRNGYVVWSDAEMEQRLGELLESPRLRTDMGRCSYEIARAWDWTLVAPQWEQRLLEIIEAF